MEKNKEELIVDPRFNLFDKSVHDPTVVASNVVNYYPLSQLSPSSSVLEFAISGEGESYIDTANIKLKITGTLKQIDGTTAADVKDGTINNLLYSLFNQVDVSYNDRLLTESTNNYSYITYLRTLLETTNDEKAGKLQSQLFYPDTYDRIDSNLGTANTGLGRRMQYTKTGNQLEMIGPLMVDVLSCKTYLLPGVNIRVKLYKNRPEFYIVSSNTSCKAAFIIEKATLLVPKLTIKNEVIIAHAEILKQQPAMFKFQKYISRIHTIPARGRSVTVENLFSDKIPSLVIICLVSSADFSGNYATNPFYLRNCNLRSMGLVLNGQHVPSNPVECDFTSAQSSNAHLFHNFTSAVKKHFSIDDTGIKMNYFYKGYTMFLFDLSDSVSKTRTGDLRLMADFTSEIDQPINIIILGRFPAKLYINDSWVISYDMF